MPAYKAGSDSAVIVLHEIYGVNQKHTLILINMLDLRYAVK